jgi:hypothetical protein
VLRLGNGVVATKLRNQQTVCHVGLNVQENFMIRVLHVCRKTHQQRRSISVLMRDSICLLVMEH